MITSEKQKGIIRNILLIGLSIAIPTLIESIYLFLNPVEYGGSYSIFDTMPSISDDVWHYNLIKSMISYLKPLGYYGFDGRHATIGTFAAWGWFILIPHFVICKLCGLFFCSGTIINIFLFAILIFLQGYFFKQTWIENIFFGVLLFAPFTLYFFDGWLMEGIVSFWGAFSAIGLAYIDKKGLNKKNILLMTCIVVFAALSKVTWSILMLPLSMILFSRPCANKIDYIKIITKIALMSSFAFVIFFSFYKFFSAPYFAGYYGIDNVSEIIRNEGFSSGIVFFINDLMHKIVSTFSINGSALYNLCSFYIVFAFVISLIWLYMSRKDIVKALIPILVIGGFVVGVTVLYDGGLLAVKTITPAATFALVYIYCHDSIVMKRVIICGALIFLFGSFWHQYSVGDSLTSVYNEEEKKSLYQLQEHINHIIVDSNTDNPWDNTVAFSMLDGYPGDDVILLLPAGTGIMLYRTLPEASKMNEKYVILTEVNVDRKNDFINSGYYVLDEFDGNTLLCR